MDFIPLPSFVNFKEEKQLRAMFTPYSYNKVANGANMTVGPSFICVYLGQRSQHLDFSDSNFKSDGFNFGVKDGTGVPDDFFESNATAVPVFVVNYGNENQSIFKDVLLDQQEFTETDEGLKIIDDIAQNGSPTNKSHIGQNLFNLYSVRSYSCEVECLGNAMIQPMMYFQLNNIPMFRGAYWIIKTSHSITPNHMTTKFKGVRIRREKTQLLDASTIFSDFIGDINNSVNTKSQLTGIFGGTLSTATNKDDQWIKDGEMKSDTVLALDAVYPVDVKHKIGSPIGLRGASDTSPHYGIDIYCPVDTNVHTISDGTIYYIGIGSGFGLHMIIEHDVNGEKVFSLYGHLNAIDSAILTSAGISNYDQIDGSANYKYPTNLKVTKSQKIAESGGNPTTCPKTSAGNSFGGLTAGPHLHLEIRTATNKSQFWDNSPLVNGTSRQLDSSGNKLKSSIVNDPVQVIQKQTTFDTPTPPLSGTPSPRPLSRYGWTAYVPKYSDYMTDEYV
jgi:murein DD-endopeptidase MepM/ murein hydrolase activator NlpD